MRKDIGEKAVMFIDRHIWIFHTGYSLYMLMVGKEDLVILVGSVFNNL
jgi:hypothetical protein